MQAPESSLLIRMATWVREKSLWLAIILALVWIGAAFLMAYAYGVLTELLATGNWRFLVMQPVIILYILFIAPWLQRAQGTVVDVLRPIALVSDEEYAQVRAQYGRPNPRSEVWAMLVGAGFPLLVEGASLLQTKMLGLSLMVLLASMAMYAMMGLVIFDSVAGTRLIGAIHALPMDVDLFDIQPFESVGRQSVVLVLAFAGGSTLSLFFSFSWRYFLNWFNLLVYMLLAGVTVLVFFLNMRHTHRVLAAAKRTELAVVQSAIGRAYRRLRQRQVDDPLSTSGVSELGAWLALEQRLNAARTWPYNTEMLRLVFVSVLIPLAVSLARNVVFLLYNRALQP